MDFLPVRVQSGAGIYRQLDRKMELVEHQKKGGRVVGSFCIHVPDEVVTAAGAIATGLCSGSQFWVPGGEKKLPTATCPLIKASLGARFDRTCPFFRLADLFVGETTYDGKKKAWEILAEDAPMYIMDIPQMKRERDYAHWGDGIRGYIRRLEELTGNRVTEGSLNDAIVLLNGKRRALRRLLKGGDVWSRSPPHAPLGLPPQVRESG